MAGRAVRQVLSKSFTIRVLLVTSYPALRENFDKEIIGGLREGTISQQEDISSDGVERLT